MRSLIISLQSEFYKSRKTLAFWAAILLPVIICGLVMIGFYSSAERLGKFPATAQWAHLVSSTLNLMGFLILPFYVIFMAFSVNNIEHKNDTWKTLFAQPLNKLSIFAAKYLYGVLLIAICMVLFPLLTWISACGLQLLSPAFKFGEISTRAMLAGFYTRLFLSAIGIFSLQFMLSLLWSDFLKPMGIGFIGTIMGLITANAGWKYAKFIPYSLPTMAINDKSIKNPMAGDFPVFTEPVLLSLGFSVIFFIAGYYILSKKNIK